MCQSSIGLNLGTAKSSHICLNLAHLIALTPNLFWDSAGQGSQKKTMPWKRGGSCTLFLMATLKRGGEGDDVAFEL
jgi:hypothetical protein